MAWSDGGAQRQPRPRGGFRRFRMLPLGGAAVVVVVVALTSCGGSGALPATRVTAVSGTATADATSRARSRQTTAGRSSTTQSSSTAQATPPPPVGPHVLVSAPTLTATTGWKVVARVHGVAAAWLAQRPGVTLMRFDQRHVHLVLHAGSSDGGVVGWRYGDQITPSEIHLVVAAFNGGFKLTYANVGFVSGGHVAVALKPGLASVVTYTDGTTNIGSFGDGVPSRRKTVYSVLQNQRLLVDRGVPAANVATCVLACWGATIQSLVAVARSGLGIDAAGRVVWAAGEQLTPATLAAALIGAGAVRAIELDINPDWVDGYLYVHGGTGPTPNPVIPGQRGIAGEFLAPYTRDFFTIVAD